MQLSVPGQYHWYALYTRARAEKKVAQGLITLGIENYLPLKRTLKQWSDRKKWVEEPLLRSYVFVRISEKEYFEVLKTTGVVRFITFTGKAAAIPDWQIDSLRILLGGNEDFEVVAEDLKPGDLVEVVSGPLAGFRGEMLDWKGRKTVALKISGLGMALAVSVSIDSLRKV